MPADAGVNVTKIHQKKRGTAIVFRRDIRIEVDPTSLAKGAQQALFSGGLANAIDDVFGPSL